MDWSSFVDFKVSPLELVLRGTAIFWFLFAVFRFVLHRDVGGIGVADILLIVLVADASQNAMAGGYTSVGEGLVLISTLVFWNYVFDWAGFRFPAVRRVLEPRPLPLVMHGKILHRNLRVEHLTIEDLRSQLRQVGVEDFAEVKRAFMESDGNLSVIKRKRSADISPPRRTPAKK